VEIDVTGRFISLEGGEGAGKTTLVKSLRETLQARDLEVIVSREPGGTPGAELLRDLLVNGATDRWSPMTEALLMYASRVDHVEKLIKPALERGAWVLCDRFADSTTAYQGAAGGVDLKQIALLHQACLGDFKPDLTLVVDLDPEIGIKRTVKRGEDASRFERFDVGFHNRLRDAYLTIASAEPERCVLLDGSQPPDHVFDAAITAIDTRLGVHA
jgi:dTMP kinase